MGHQLVTDNGRAPEAPKHAMRFFEFDDSSDSFTGL